MLVVRKIGDVKVARAFKRHRGIPFACSVVVNDNPCFEFLCVARLSDIIILAVEIKTAYRIPVPLINNLLCQYKCINTMIIVNR